MSKTIASRDNITGRWRFNNTATNHWWVLFSFVGARMELRGETAFIVIKL